MSIVPAHDALVVGITKDLADIQERDDYERHAWVIWAAGFDAGDRTSLADDIVEYLSLPNVRPLLTRFVAELHAADLDGEVRPS